MGYVRVRLHANLLGKHRVEKTGDIGRVNCQLETDNLTGGVDALVCSGASLELCCLHALVVLICDDTHFVHRIEELILNRSFCGLDLQPHE